MKVIFLDFDGVLNSRNYNPPEWTSGVLIDPTRMKLLKQIIDATEARIVLSTSWREHWDKNMHECNVTGNMINKIFGDFGITIYDKTPQMHNERDQEIEAWLSEHPDVTDYVIIDDLPFELSGFQGHFVLTSNLRQGLAEDDVRKAIRILNDE